MIAAIDLIVERHIIAKKKPIEQQSNCFSVL
jgi:hypothetical protein